MVGTRSTGTGSQQRSGEAHEHYPLQIRPQAETIVLIHGMWMTPLSWEHCASHYIDRGHRVIAPAWPGLDKEPEELRRDPSPLRGIDITEVVDHYDKIIRGLDRPPIIIGHSFGGLFAQLLLDRGLGAAGVALGTAAPKGVLRLPYSTLQGGLAGATQPGESQQGDAADAGSSSTGASRTRSAGRTRTPSTSVTTSREARGPSSRPVLANFNPNAKTKVNYKNPARRAAAARHRHGWIASVRRR